MSKEVDTEVELDSISIILEMLCESILPLVAFEASAFEQAASFL